MFRKALRVELSDGGWYPVHQNIVSTISYPVSFLTSSNVLCYQTIHKFIEEAGQYVNSKQSTLENPVDQGYKLNMSQFECLHIIFIQKMGSGQKTLLFTR